MLTAIRTQFAEEDRKTLLGRLRFGRRPERDRIVDAAFTLRRVVGEAATRVAGEDMNRDPDLNLMDKYLMRQAVREEAAAIVADPQQLRQLRGVDVHAAWLGRAVRD